MFIRVFRAALISFLLVNVHCQGATWNNCSESIVDSLRDAVVVLQKIPIVVQNVSVCAMSTINLNGIDANTDCVVRNCSGNMSDCIEQKLGFHVNNFTFSCDIEDTKIILEDIVPEPQTSRAEGGLTTAGSFSDVFVSVTYHVICAKGKGAATMTNSTFESKPRSLSISCTEGNELFVEGCNNMFKSPATREEWAAYVKEAFEGYTPEILQNLTVRVAKINCQ